MSDLNEHEEGEIVDLDTCSKWKSVRFGAVITLLLSVVGMGSLGLMPAFLFGGFAASAHYAKAHKIKVPVRRGILLGVLATALGGFVFSAAVLTPQYLNKSDDEWAQEAETQIQTAYEEGMPWAAELLEKVYSENSVSVWIASGFLSVIPLTLVFGVLGGMLGALLVKKGPLAQ